MRTGRRLDRRIMLEERQKDEGLMLEERQKAEASGVRCWETGEEEE